MVQTLEEWLATDVARVKDKNTQWLSEYYFHRVEARATYVDNQYFFTPCDGVIMDVHESIEADKPFIEAKGTKLTLRDLMADETLEGKFLVVSTFMTFYSQHENFIPFTGNRTYQELPPLSTYNKPMLAVEKDILNGVINPAFQEDYLRKNGREISEIFSAKLNQEYFVVRIGDYDVDCMINYKQSDGEESTPYNQNDRFGKISYGSQTILIIPQYETEGACKFKLRSEAKVSNYVKCKKTALVEVIYPEK